MTNEQWTAEVPTRPGVYKWKAFDRSKPFPDWVYAGQLDANGIMEINCRQLPAAEWGGVWCGPLVPEPVGIVGKLVEAGTLEGMDGFHGLLIEVPVEDLRKAASVPLYRKVMIIDASLT